MARRMSLLSTGLTLLTVICFFSNVAFIVHHFSISHIEKPREIQEKAYFDEYNAGDSKEVLIKSDEILDNKNRDAIPRKRKHKRRPAPHGDHRKHHHGKMDEISGVDSGRILQPEPKASPENNDQQENIRQQLQENEDQMKQFLLKNHFGVDDTKGDIQDKFQLNEEMMRRFFEKDALNNLKDMRLANQEILRNTMEMNSQKKPQSQDKISHNNIEVDNITASHEPYFMNTRDADKNGPGLMGAAGVLGNIGGMDKEREKEGYKKHSFNEYLSSKISLHRSLRDPRYPECRNISYPRNLPKTSIVICFHNEAWSTLLRTLHSILDRSPHHLIEEILFVDDGSLMGHLKEPLEDYIANIHEVPIRIIRTNERIGLIQARTLGAEKMKGEILTFLDSHVEVSVGWLEPLLARVAGNRTRVVMPIVDIINDKDFEYEKIAEPLQRGGFNWRLQYRWKNTPGYHSRPKASPIRTPAMPGGLFSMDRNYFIKLGGYDPGMDIWGGENIEESLKVWMCGGTIEIMPCSRVGHIFRSTPPYSYKGKSALTVVEKNSRRVAEVWIDEPYRQHFLDRYPHLKSRSYGDVSDRIALRKKLGCKSFQWYLDEVYPELYRPNVQTDLERSAAVKNLGVSMCLDANDQNGEPGKKLIIWNCHGLGGNQYFELTSEGEFRIDELCLEGDSFARYVLLNDCRKGTQPVPERQKWIHKKDGKFYNPSTKACMSVSSKTAGTPVELRMCNPLETKQKWQFT